MNYFIIKTASSIHEIDSEIWDQLSAGRPFQSHGWYAFGEQVMADSPPTYLLVYKNNYLVARAAFWLIRDEPVPKMLGIFRKSAKAFIQRWPPMICRSPLAFSGGIILPDGESQSKVATLLTQAALAKAKRQKASFVMYDYLSKPEANQFVSLMQTMSAPAPGTFMKNRWASIDEYLASRGKKDRQHYKRVYREAGKLGVRVERHDHVENINQALTLIRNVEQKHGAYPNPWAREMLAQMQMVNSTFLTAKIEEKLVGCGLLFEDNSAQMASTLGLVEDIPYVYFVLMYESLKIAFEHQVHLLRWGSGAYDVKQRLGFSFEDNGMLAFNAANPSLQKIIGRLN